MTRRVLMVLLFLLALGACGGGSVGPAECGPPYPDPPGCEPYWPDPPEMLCLEIATGRTIPCPEVAQ